MKQKKERKKERNKKKKNDGISHGYDS